MSAALVLLLSIAPPEALAGVSLDNHHGIFPAEPSLSDPPLEGFREVYLEAGAIGELHPAAPGGAGGVLVLPNDTTTSAEVLVDGRSVGIVGPLDTARIHGVAPGVYAVTWRLPNGYTFERRIATTEEAQAAE